MTIRLSESEERLRRLLWNNRLVMPGVAVAGLTGGIVGPALGPLAWSIVGFGGLLALGQIYWVESLGFTPLWQRRGRASHTLEAEERRARCRGSAPDAGRIAHALKYDEAREHCAHQIRITLATGGAVLGIVMAALHS